MTEDRPRTGARLLSALISLGGLSLLAFVLLPIVALVLASSPGELIRAVGHPAVPQALWLSVRTSTLSLLVVLVTGTPLAWILARRRSPWIRIVEPLVELPIVIPPAVVGIALLLAFGRQGLFGPLLTGVGWSIPFTMTAVVMAQIVVAAPFYIQSAKAGFRSVDEDLLLVARTLGASRAGSFVRVAIPTALPALVNGAALFWARAIGEFGATLLFAGNLPGQTQTMPLSIYSALEVDVDVATATALILAGFALGTLALARVAKWGVTRRRGTAPDGGTR